MSVTNRKPLARIVDDGIVDEHHDGHGMRITTAKAVEGGVLISIRHSDGRQLRLVIPCR